MFFVFAGTVERRVLECLCLKKKRFKGQGGRPDKARQQQHLRKGNEQVRQVDVLSPNTYLPMPNTRMGQLNWN